MLGKFTHDVIPPTRIATTSGEVYDLDSIDIVECPDCCSVYRWTGDLFICQCPAIDAGLGARDIMPEHNEIITTDESGRLVRIEYVEVFLD